MKVYLWPIESILLNIGIILIRVIINKKMRSYLLAAGIAVSCSALDVYDTLKDKVASDSAQ